MMENQELFKQAILDAKAVRETAMAAAKSTLAEHFEPYIKETIEKTLAEEMEEGQVEEAMHPDMEENMASEMDENTLDEILAELDALSEDPIEEGDELEEGHTGYDKKAHVTEAEEGGDDEKGEEAEKENKPEEVEGPDEQEVVDITVGELKDIIRDVFMQLQGGDDMGPAMDAGTDLAADLGGEEGDEGEISLDEILAELEKEEGKKMEENDIPGDTSNLAHVAKVEEMKKELNEAVKTIKALKTELNEINLFSAKLLYVNKIFKAKNLSEAQKTKVINAFDRAESVKEVENTYKTLLESISAETKKSSLKESVGFASKPIGNAPARPIVEADAFVTRWQMLAGIK